jgi:tetratricopeptide (TPR) repeat protein
MFPYEEAIIDYTKGIELDGGDAYAYRSRGSAYRSLERYEEAISDYTKSIELDGGDVCAYSNRGSAYDSLGRYEEAIIDYTKSIELEEGDAIAYRNRADGYEKLGRHEEAQSDRGIARSLFDKKIEKNPREYFHWYYIQASVSFTCTACCQSMYMLHPRK